MKRILLIFMSVMLLFASFAVLPTWADTTSNETVEDVIEGAEEDIVIPTEDTVVDAENMVVCIGEKEIDGVKILNGKALVPLRAVFEALGCTVKYTQSNGLGTVGIQRGITTVSLQEKNPYMTINDSANGISTPLIDESDPSITPRNVDGSIYIPAKAVAEALFCNVWFFDPRLDDDPENDEEPSKITLDPRTYITENCHHDRFVIVKRIVGIGDKGVEETFLCDRINMEKVQFDTIQDTAITKIVDLTLAKNGFPVILKVIKENSSDYYFINDNPDAESLKAELFVPGETTEENQNAVNEDILLSFFNKHNTFTRAKWERNPQNKNFLVLKLENGPEITYDEVNNTYASHTGYTVKYYEITDSGNFIFEMQYVYNEPGI